MLLCYPSPIKTYYTPTCISGSLWGVKTVRVAFPTRAEREGSSYQDTGDYRLQNRLILKETAPPHPNFPALSPHKQHKLHEGRSFLSFWFFFLLNIQLSLFKFGCWVLVAAHET